MKSQSNVVTGAFGYIGQHITKGLIADGIEVRTITGHLDRPDPFKGKVKVFPFNFDNPDKLVENLKGSSVLYNTYWVRFNHGETTFKQAVSHTKTLINAAVEAGVERFVHISITNPSLESKLPYFKGKAEIENMLINSGLSYAIIRPTVLFGGSDVLINNIAWILRRFPIFGLPGLGRYKLQPIHVDDLAALAVKQGQSRENCILDAVGPEIYSFRQLVVLIAKQIGCRSLVLPMPKTVALLASRMLGAFLGDVVLTRDEISGLSEHLLVSSDEPTGGTLFSDWLTKHKDALGGQYASELARHYQ